MKVRFFNPGYGYECNRDEILGEIDRVLKAGDLILRKDVEDFEAKVAAYTDTEYCVALNSCTDALYLALRYLKIGKGDLVVVPSRTFVASAQVIVQCGGTPVFYDLEEDFDSWDWSRVKAIIPVHIEGAFDTQFAKLLEKAQVNNIPVIEDAAQAFGAVDENGRKAGGIGLAGCFSFYPAKTLGAYGDAGALVTNDKDLYEWVKGARNHFKEDARDWGVNSRLDNVQAAVLNVKFKIYDAALARRKQIAEMYTSAFSGLGMALPIHTDGRIWQDYIVRTPKRDELYDFLKVNSVETMKNNYPFPVPKMPLAQQYEDETLRLPCNELLSDEEVNYVIELIKDFYNHHVTTETS